MRIEIKGLEDVRSMLSTCPKQAARATEIALNVTGKKIKEDIQSEMQRVFDRPVPYTLNSLQLTPATSSKLTATVWFKEPPRMGQHYLMPQVDGGQRKLKGFERGIGLGEMEPAVGAKRDRYGNVSVGQLRQIMSVLGKAEVSAGYAANKTARSATRNIKERDYVLIDRRQRGNLPIGIYQRFQDGPKVTALGRRTAQRVFDARARLGLGGRGGYANPSDRSRAYERGHRRAVIRARGLRPVLLATGTKQRVRPLLRFYVVAGITFSREFEPAFLKWLAHYLAR